MATSVEWGTQIITILQADMTPLGGDIYEFDVNAFRLELNNLQDDEYGIPMPTTHEHNTEVTISGITYARTVRIINGYTVTISPAGAYQVSCTGANHNVQDVLNNLGGPTFLPNNSAGLIVSAVSGLTAQEALDLADLKAAHFNKMVTDPVTGKLTIYEDDDSTPRKEGDIFEDAAGTQPYQGKGSERRDQLT